MNKDACYVCGKVEHYARECLDNKKEQTVNAGKRKPVIPKAGNLVDAQKKKRREHYSNVVLVDKVEPYPYTVQDNLETDSGFRYNVHQEGELEDKGNLITGPLMYKEVTFAKKIKVKALIDTRAKTSLIVKHFMMIYKESHQKQLFMTPSKCISSWLMTQL